MANVTLNVVNGFDKVVERTWREFGRRVSKIPARWVTEEISVGGFSSALPAGKR